MLGNVIYLDHAATTPVPPEVLEAMVPYFSEEFGNASSIHQLGRRNRAVIEENRSLIARFLHANPDEIIFTGSGTESDNMAVLGTAYRLRKYGKHVITTNYEHPAVRNPFRKLETDGFDVTYLKVSREGLVDPEDVKEAIRNDTILVSVMFVNNEIGTINPIKEIAEITSEKGIIFHTDAVQAFGKIPIDLSEIKVDLLSASAHKIYGPKGIGLLFMRNGGADHPKFGRYIQPILFGGGHEFGYRPGTENVPGIVGFGRAAELAFERMDKERERLKIMRDDFIDWVLREIPGARLNGSRERRLENNINLSFKGINGELLLKKLDENGIAVSSGSACHSKSGEPSYVLQAIGLSEEEANGSIRITLGLSNREQDLHYVKEILREIIFEFREGQSGDSQ